MCPIGARKFYVFRRINWANTNVNNRLEMSILEKGASFARNYRVPVIQPQKAVNVVLCPIGVNNANAAAVVNFADQTGYAADQSAFEL